MDIRKIVMCVNDGTASKKFLLEVDAKHKMANILLLNPYNPVAERSVVPFWSPVIRITWVIRITPNYLTHNG